MSLGVLVDGVALPEAEARAFWDRFSRYMEDHPRDLAGFAKAEGLASVHPQMGAGGATLVASKVAPQRPYANAAAQPSSGSSNHQRRSPEPSAAKRGSPKSAKKSR